MKKLQKSEFVFLEKTNPMKHGSCKSISELNLVIVSVLDNHMTEEVRIGVYAPVDNSAWKSDILSLRV
ncbi:MAG: hypothetical protein RTU30_06215 [Candidatus Thorarchaeota archaeon]